jgi:hypothetical protein
VEMIKAEIITDASVYNLALHDFEDLETAYAFVSKELAHPDAAEFRGPDVILCIDLVDSKIKSYRVYREETNPLENHFGHVLPPAGLTEARNTPGEPWAVTQPALFLGRKIQLEALLHEVNGQRFVMPLTLDGRLPHDAMAEGSLRKVLQQAFPDAEAVIPPPVTLTGAESTAFLMDYAEQAAPELRIPGEVNARAAGKVFE